LLRRADGCFTYALANVVDDLCDGVTEVVRGADLLEYSAVQVRLWEAFGATPPTWLHAPLVLGPDGRKLSKSHGAVHVGDLRSEGWQPADVWAVALPWLGIEPVERIEDAVAAFAPERFGSGPVTWVGLPLRRRR
jgi:glutamyl/glutaminyl-tRNA synthetase